MLTSLGGASVARDPCFRCFVLSQPCIFNVCIQAKFIFSDRGPCVEHKYKIHPNLPFGEWL